MTDLVVTGDGVRRSLARRLAVLVAIALAVGGCPLPLDTVPAAPSPTTSATTTSAASTSTASSTTRVAPDAQVVLRAPQLGALLREGGALLRALDTEGSSLQGLSSSLSAIVGGDFAAAARAKLSGLDPQGALTVSFRRTGDVVGFVPVADRARFAATLSRFGEPADALGPVAVFRRPGAEDIALLVLDVPGGVLLSPSPVDLHGSAALLRSMAAGTAGPADVDAPAGSALLLGRARPEGLSRVAPTLAALLPSDDLDRITLSAHPDDGGARLEIELHSQRAPEPLSPLPPPGFCALLDGALLAARFPASWAAESDAGPGRHLTAELALAVYPPLSEGGVLRWVAISKPRDAASVQALRAEVSLEGAKVEEREIGGRKARVTRAGDGSSAVVVSIVEADVFVLASGEPPQLAAALSGRSACGDSGMTSGIAWARSEPLALRAALTAAAKGGGPVAALARVASRVDLGSEQLTLRLTQEAAQVRRLTVDLRAAVR